MTTITLIQAAAHDATGIHLMTARPMNVNLNNLQGGAIQFQCSNPLATIAGAKEVEITYNAAHGGRHETIQVSSVIA
nr:hypothetical protein [uncultured Duganella sp.]